MIYIIYIHMYQDLSYLFRIDPQKVFLPAREYGGAL